MNFAKVTEQIGAARAEIGRVVTGYEDVVTDLLVGLLSKGHVLMEGVPGLAKTTLAKTFATVSGLTFRRIQFTQDLLPADITGHYFFNQKSRDFELREGPLFANIVLADEINRAPPKTQSALLEAMEERQVTIEGQTYPLPDPFMVVATMNPIDVEGVYHLPEAQLDRFMIRTQMSYLAAESEREMLFRKLGGNGAGVRQMPGDFVANAQRAAASVRIEASVVRYLQELGLATRSHPHVSLGASPRAMEQALIAARSLAAIEGRAFVLPDDVKRIVPKAFNHRLILSVDAEIDGVTAPAILAKLLAEAEVPKGFSASSPAPG